MPRSVTPESVVYCEQETQRNKKSNKIIDVVMRCVANPNFHDMLNNKNVSQETSTLTERNHIVFNQLSSILENLLRSTYT